MPVEAWFPTLVFYEDIPVPRATIEAALAAIREAVGDEMLATVPRYTAAEAPNTLHLDPRLDPLLGELVPVIGQFLFDILHFDSRSTEFYIGRCWPVVQNARGKGELHRHAGALLSGVFYLDAPEGSGGIEFRKPYWSSYDHTPKTELTAVTFSHVTYAAATNRLLLFASDLLHRALPNTGDLARPRIAIAFDIYSMTQIDNHEGGIPHIENLKKILS